ncbi:enoyl-CoA hydratase [Corynebacterium amycolatum]|uniref:enoyl-CoA hydratase n=1 Tax=Corynebacterium TaxID=1716 RepID=UPI0008A4ADF1|nr:MULTISPECIES: enoyl-CoA hydratase [Corynebacterium]KAA9268956.1 enoyl-CoA hydratase [Corynebacterium amycolatum]KAA9289470.1 enoyl-CoA hydratase [Corynebacterium amycolatum]MBC6757438.1 enoyl-CoA hydratase [Corynebacterium sp. LK24]MBU5624786.1 enoyl-CoA hydratase [Corynebacterium amycolatum]MCG7245821.1 enoyl-CoA hydratase [Corynebacterium sp. ACRPX]
MTNPASEIRVEADGAIVTITIDRDHKRNSLTADVCREIADAVEAAAEVPEQRVILLRGEGRAFCAGADLSGQHHENSFHEQLRRMLRTIEASRLVVIADVQGPAVGAGMQLAMAADLRVVGERGWFMIPPVKLGIAVDAWTIRRVRVLVGGARARTILLAAERMDQEAARGCGLASYLGGPDTAEEVALRIATYAPLSLAYHKAVLNDDETHSPLKDYQQELYDTVWASEDAAEASKARAEKREPNFVGK